MATFDEYRQAVEILNPMRDKNQGTYQGGRRKKGRSCDRGPTGSWKEKRELITNQEGKKDTLRTRIIYHTIY